MATSDAQIADAIRTALADRASAGGAGTVSVTIDGVTTQYDWEAAKNQLLFHERRAGRPRRPIVSQMDLSGF